MAIDEQNPVATDMAGTEKEQIKHLDTAGAVVPPGEEEAVEHMSLHAYLGLLVSVCKSPHSHVLMLVRNSLC